jgi:hypothetical protein
MGTWKKSALFRNAVVVLNLGLLATVTWTWPFVPTHASLLTGGALYLFPLPPDYERALVRKLSVTSELRQRFRQLGLGKEKERELNDTIQAHFKVGQHLLPEVSTLSSQQ